MASRRSERGGGQVMISDEPKGIPERDNSYLEEEMAKFGKKISKEEWEKNMEEWKKMKRSKI
jgi:hypothetical protein